MGIPAHKIKVMVCPDCHELVQKTGSVYFEKKPQPNQNQQKMQQKHNILNKFKQTRETIILTFALEQKKQQTFIPQSYRKIGELEQKFIAV